MPEAGLEFEADVVQRPRGTSDLIITAARPCDLQDSKRELAIRVFLFRINPRRPFTIYFVVSGEDIRILRVRGPGQREMTLGEIPMDFR